MAVQATAVWRVRPSGSNVNGGGYDPGIAGAATDYSQQNAAQATGTLGTAAGTAAFSDAGGAFTAAMIGNALWIASGAGFTVGAYFITAFTSSTAVTLDRSPGTGTVAHWALGGAWADFWTNTTSAGPLVPGNTVFILGSGTPNPAAYVYDYSPGVSFTPTNGDAVNGNINFVNDPATPGYKAAPDTTGGMPTIKQAGAAGQVFASTNGNGIIGLWFVATANTGNIANGGGGNPYSFFFGCVFDAFGFDTSFTSGIALIIGTEVFSSVAAGATTTQTLLSPLAVIGCNIHDVRGVGIGIGSGSVVDSIIAKCGSNGIKVNASSVMSIIKNNTIDGNGGNGIEIATQGAANVFQIFNNIISNHTVAGKSGLVVDVGTAAQNSRVASFVDYNTYYNNTSDVTAINYGPHDTHGGSNPYVAQSTENYTLA